MAVVTDFAQAAVVHLLEIGAVQHVGQRAVAAFAVVEQQDGVRTEARRKIDVVQHENVEMPRPVRAPGQV